MLHDESTCWTVIRDAARGKESARQDFARRYLGVVRAYLRTRWGRGPQSRFIDDAVQDVFLECFRQRGPLDRADPEHPGRFQQFLHAVVRNVARRYEDRRSDKEDHRGDSILDELAAEDLSLAKAFDQAWARSILQQAGRRQAAFAAAQGEAAQRRVTILELRFGEGLAVRDIAKRLDMEADLVHAEYRKAREEFRRALREEVLFHHPDRAANVDEECRRISSFFE